MKIYILLILLLFTSCVSNNSRTNQPIKTNKNIEITLRKQEIEFKRLKAENDKLVEDIENLNEKIQEIKDLFELN